MQASTLADPFVYSARFCFIGRRNQDADIDVSLSARPNAFRHHPDDSLVIVVRFQELFESCYRVTEIGIKASRRRPGKHLVRARLHSSSEILTSARRVKSR